MHKEQYFLYRIGSFSSKNIYTNNSRSSDEISAFEVFIAATCLAYEEWGSIFLRNVGELPYYTALHLRRLSSKLVQFMSAAKAQNTSYE